MPRPRLLLFLLGLGLLLIRFSLGLVLFLFSLGLLLFPKRPAPPLLVPASPWDHDSDGWAGARPADRRLELARRGTLGIGIGIAGVAPGDSPYHGGDWQVFVVTFDAGVTPYLLTSDEAVAAAAAAGDVTVTRSPAADFRCPFQP